jgi:hypothetical protein
MIILADSRLLWLLRPTFHRRHRNKPAFKKKENFYEQYQVVFLRFGAGTVFCRKA